MDEIVTERAKSILCIQLNRPAKRNAMTSVMYVALAGLFNEAATDANTRVVLWHGAGDSFCAGNDIEDFLKNPPGPGESSQARLMHALVDFDKPIVAAVHSAAIGGGTTMLTHCDFIYAGEGTRFQMPFINLALVPEFGSSCSMPARIGHLRAAELILLGGAFRCRARCGAGSHYPGRIRQGRPGESQGNRAEAGGDAGGSAASQQEADEAAISRTDQGCDDG
jgi:enoyl-CoA hydratase/carnithine racemase